MYLQELFDYKNQLVSDLISNKEIVRLVDPSVPFEQAETLIYNKIFPYEFVPETIEHGDTYICCDVDIQSTSNKTYLSPTIYIWVFTHKSLMRLPEGGVRTDLLCSEICKTINGSRMYGLGELNIYSVKRFAPMTDYQGKCMTFHATDFNRLYEYSKPIPDRRRG